MYQKGHTPAWYPWLTSEVPLLYDGDSAEEHRAPRTTSYVQPGAATCSEGFVFCFLKGPFACLVSMAAAVQPNCLWNSQKTLNKTFYSTCRPTLYVQPGAASCSEGFVFCFLKIPLACLRCMAAAVRPNCLGNSQKTCYKTFGTSCRPIL